MLEHDDDLARFEAEGAAPLPATPLIGRCIGRHIADYTRLSATPDQFDALSEAVGLMQRTQPNYPAHDLPQTLPNPELVDLRGVSHFVPLQRPALFNQAVPAFRSQLP